MKFYMFRTVRLFIIRSLFTVHSAMVYVIQVCRQLSSRNRMVIKFVIKPIRCTNFTNLFWHETTCFGQFVCPSSGVYSLYTQ